jgi:hypothetical protein
VFAFAAIGQKNKADTVRKDFFPTGIRVGTDVIALIRTQTDNSFSGYEINADVDFYRYFLTIDAGRWKRNFSNDEDTYDNKGNYMRVGVDINFLKKDPEKNMFFFGARYGWGTYTESFETTVTDAVYGTQLLNYRNSDVKASWAELTTGLRVKIWKTFWMGYTVRYKFALDTNEGDDFVSHDVPGYGRTDKNSTWGFNYQILFRIPIRKAATSLPTEKSTKKP